MVRNPSGELLDVTLRRCDPSYEFVPHPFDDDHSRRLVIGLVPTLDHLLGPDPIIPLAWSGENASLDNRLF